MWLLEGNSEAQTGDTSHSGHQGKPLTLVLGFICEVKWIKGLYLTFLTIAPSQTDDSVSFITYIIHLSFLYKDQKKFRAGWILSMRQVDAVHQYSGLFWTILWSPSCFSLGCSAAALGSAGGCSAAAKAGTTEVQHGQRSAGGGKCETSDDFPLTRWNIRPLWLVAAGLSERTIALIYHLDITVCRQSSNASWVKGTNYLANMRYCLLLYTRQCVLLAIEMQIKPRAIHLSCHNSSSSGGRTEYCSSSSKSLMKLSTRHMKSAWDGYAAWQVSHICAK